MGKILVYIAIVVTFISAGLGVLNTLTKKEKVALHEQAQADLADAKNQLSESTAQLAEVNQKLQAEQEALANTQEELEEAGEKLQKAEAQVATATQAAQAEKSRAAQLSQDMSAKDQKIAQLSAELEQAKSQPSQPAAPSDDTLAQLQEKEQLLQLTEQKLTDTQNQLADLQKRERERAQLKMRDGLEGRILAVNPAWNFVVLSLGDRNGVIANSELLVKRGPRMIGKVRVTAVEPNTSIADIVANSVPNGFTIQPGDDVIYRSVDDIAN